jgi:hypothetical protein
MYDVPALDDGKEWVGLLNTSTNSIDLSTWSRGYRRLDYTFGTLQLSGIIAPGAVFVVGRPISDATNGNPTYNQSITFNPPLLNSGTTADGTALFNVPAAQTTPTTIPIDAIVYGGANLNNLIDETGLANPPDAPDVSGRLRTIHPTRGFCRPVAGGAGADTKCIASGRKPPVVGDHVQCDRC